MSDCPECTRLGRAYAACLRETDRTRRLTGWADAAAARAWQRHLDAVCDAIAEHAAAHDRAEAVAS